MGGPMSPGHQAASCDPRYSDCVHYVWAHNGAAVIGILLCVFLLGLWFDLRFGENDDDSEGEPPA